MELPLDLPNFRPRNLISTVEISSALAIGHFDREVRLVPIQDEKIAVFSNESVLLGVWDCTHEEYEAIKSFSLASEVWHKKRRQLYLDAIRGGEPKGSDLARDLRNARQETIPRQPKLAGELLDL